MGSSARPASSLSTPPTPPTEALLILALALACRPDAAPPPTARSAPASIPGTLPEPRWRTNSRLVPDRPPDPRPDPRPARLPARLLPAPPAPSPASTVSALLPRLEGARFDRTVGEGMAAAVAALEGERALLGAHGLSLATWRSETAGCEEPEILLPLEHEGRSWEARLRVPATMWLSGPPAPLRAAVAEACAQSLLDTPGAPERADCDEATVRAFFPEGSGCRACLEEDGDLARCRAEGRCAEEAWAQVFALGAWSFAWSAPTLLCAPDLQGRQILLAPDEPDGAAPARFAHGLFTASCLEVWSESQGGTVLSCTAESGPGLGTADILLSRLVGYTRDGEAQATHAGRVSVIGALEVEGTTFADTILYGSGATAVSAPVGSSDDAWGIHPFDLRPGGLDPLRVEDTMARDYLAALALKTATSINGVVVQPFHRNRCPDDGWVGPKEDGTYDCPRPGPWSEEGWYDDAAIVFYGRRSIYAFPLLTLVSTGLPDPALPGALAPRILGSTTLADPEWEACAWPETFIPDTVRMWDDAPADGGEPYASFDGQTWRFGRDGEGGVIMGLLTNQRRGFCP